LIELNEVDAKKISDVHDILAKKQFDDVVTEYSDIIKRLQYENFGTIAQRHTLFIPKFINDSEKLTPLFISALNTADIKVQLCTACRISIDFINQSVKISEEEYIKMMDKYITLFNEDFFDKQFETGMNLYSHSGEIRFDTTEERFLRYRRLCGDTYLLQKMYNRLETLGMTIANYNRMRKIDGNKVVILYTY
jgi:hypothetical protein